MDAEVMELRMKQWLPIFEEQARSGLNKKEWCRENGIKKWDFYKWQREVRRYLIEREKQLAAASGSGCSIETGCSFVDITPIEAPLMLEQPPPSVFNSSGRPKAASISINYGGFSIDLAAGVDEALLSTVLKVVANVK